MKLFWKILLGVLCLLSILLILTSAALPTWFSYPMGKERLTHWINESIPGEVTWSKGDFNWISGQTLENLVVSDASGSEVFTLEKFHTDTSLLYLLFGGRKLKNTRFFAPNLHWEEAEKGASLVSKALEKKERKKKRSFLPQFTGSFSLKEGEIFLDSPKISPITIDELAIEKTEDPETFHFVAKTNQGGIQGEIALAARLEGKMKLLADIKNFPIALFDQLEGTTLFTQAIGPTLDLNGEIEKDLENSLLLNIQIKSQNLTGTVKGKTEEKKFLLNPSSQLTFTVTPGFFQNWVQEEKRGDWSLASKTAVKIEIEQGIFPLNLKKPDYSEIVFQGRAYIDRAEITHKTLGSYSLKQFDVALASLDNLEIAYKGAIQGKEATELSGNLSLTPEGDLFYTSQVEGFPVSLLELFSPDLANNVRALLGSSFNLYTQGTYQEKQFETTFQIASSQLELNGRGEGDLPLFSFSLAGIRKFPAPSSAYLGSPLEFQVRGRGEFLEEGARLPQLSGTFSSSHLEGDFRGSLGQNGEGVSYETMTLLAKGKILKLPYQEEIPDLEIENGNFLLRVDGAKNQITGKAAIDTIRKEENHSLAATFTIQDYIREEGIDFSQSKLLFSTDLEALPVAMLQGLVPESFNLPQLLGETLDIEADGEYQNEQGTLALKATGEGIHAALSFSIEETLRVKQEELGSIYWEMTPTRYQALIYALFPEHEPIYTLTRTAPVVLNIQEFTCPKLPLREEENFFCQSGFSASIEIGKLFFRGQDSLEPFGIHQIRGTLAGEKFSEAMRLQLEGEFASPNTPEGERSGFAFEGEVRNFWDPTGRFNRDQLAVTGSLTLDFVPIPQLTGALPIQEKNRIWIQAVLGELVNARIYGEVTQLTGEITADIKASNFKGSLPLFIRPHGIFLRDTMKAELTLTPEVNEIFLKDISPLFLTGARSEHPIILQISPQGFFCPFAPFSFSQLKIGQAVIDLGKIYVKNGGQVQSLMQFLKATEVSPDGWMEAWFTPIYMSLENGVASYARFDMLLATKMHIALWGRINLLTDQVNMTLGIAPKTLEQRFGVKGLSNQDLFQVKMTGTNNNLQLDWSAASTRIGLLIARASTGGIGAIVGGLLE
nr:hypothetical protein [Chlamydiota bacterium]